ncbi:hypothetical protein ASPVEDRAFT_35125 [Aspergillus versicolor CBS 583.65]|uniref:Major facilitator superfamily (MFS) profile domain-containing protein n=1 Tax=Aspergillus versicolor CBS 583.65 TaxID=1036611 RepID=A0A1L9P2T3_ASPVE|nr:uncharacterized protein ASPVEDRAFT_35125 [Aspergillus versicolor CBS 583.65]OJI95808.1 hypothetical protein ASPVEDRAFT_35125 [Aspergillus versicolor CBS 583.65]
MSDSRSYRETDAHQYEHFPQYRKAIIVAILPFFAALSPMSSTSILPAVPGVARRTAPQGV